jgi:SP family general alpha glucoside:H+ symporter-like MFS transporter
MTDIEGNKPIISHVEGQPLRHVTTEKREAVLIEMARGGTEIEHNLKTLEAVRIYRKGVMFAILITLSIIMRMYDIGIINSFFALPAFQQRYGTVVPGHGLQIPATWQVALGIAAVVGQVIGAMLVTYPMEWIGRKKTLAICLLMTSCLTFMQFFAPSIQVLAASEYLSGVVWGSYQVLIPTYSSEILPNVLRPYLAAWIAVNYDIGQLIIAGITTAFDTWTSQWGYRIPFAIQWVWPCIVLPTLLFCPESPWWLLRHDRVEEAEKALKRLSSPDPKVDLDKTMAMMQKTILFEAKIQENTSVWDCFRGASRYRTEIVIMVFVAQDFAQSPVSPTYFLEQLGLTTKQSFDMSVGMTSVALVCSLGTAFVLRFFGRRTAFTTGLVLTCVFQNLVGFLDLAPNWPGDKNAFGWAQTAFLIASTAVYNATLGPMAYSILTEVPSIRLRSKTVGIAIAVDAVCGIITGVALPYLINPGEGNARGKTDFLFGGISLFTMVWCWFRLPETKHRTVEEIDYMFEEKVPTRKFKGFVIDPELLKHDLE